MRLIKNTLAQPNRRGYTLVELLIVITIILILMSMTLATVNYARTGDKVSSASRQVQSFIAGARSRAMYADEVRGVRLFVEQNLGGSAAASRTVTTMAYIAPGGTWASPKDSADIQIERPDYNGDGDYNDPGEDLATIVRGFNNPGWWNLKRRGLLVDGMRIRIPAQTGNWYPISLGTDASNPTLVLTSPPPDEQLLQLQIPFNGGVQSSQHVVGTYTYEIELPTRLLPQDPSILPDKTVIDLDGSQVPASWRPTSAGGVYSGYMDILFSPRGNIIGDAAGAGLLHLYVCDAEDALFLKEQWVSQPGNSVFALDAAVAAGLPFIPVDELSGQFGVGTAAEPYLVKDRRVVSIFTQTGVISVNGVNGFDTTDANGFADDPFYFAETGEVVK